MLPKLCYILGLLAFMVTPSTEFPARYEDRPSADYLKILLRTHSSAGLKAKAGENRSQQHLRYSKLKFQSRPSSRIHINDADQHTTDVYNVNKLPLSLRSFISWPAVHIVQPARYRFDSESDSHEWTDWQYNDFGLLTAMLPYQMHVAAPLLRKIHSKLTGGTVKSRGPMFRVGRNMSNQTNTKYPISQRRKGMRNYLTTIIDAVVTTNIREFRKLARQVLPKELAVKVSHVLGTSLSNKQHYDENYRDKDEFYYTDDGAYYVDSYDEDTAPKSVRIVQVTNENEHDDDDKPDGDGDEQEHTPEPYINLDVLADKVKDRLVEQLKTKLSEKKRKHANIGLVKRKQVARFSNDDGLWMPDGLKSKNRLVAKEKRNIPARFKKVHREDDETVDIVNKDVEEDKQVKAMVGVVNHHVIEPKEEELEQAEVNTAKVQEAEIQNKPKRYNYLQPHLESNIQDVPKQDNTNSNERDEQEKTEDLEEKKIDIKEVIIHLGEEPTEEPVLVETTEPATEELSLKQNMKIPKGLVRLKQYNTGINKNKVNKIKRKEQTPADNEFFQSFALGQHNAYDEYENAKKSEDIFESEEADKTTQTNNKEDIPDNDENAEIKQQSTENLQGEGVTQNLNWDDGAPVGKAFKVHTKLPRKPRFTMVTPDYYHKQPNIAEKYNFDEPIPERDRSPEKLGRVALFSSLRGKVNGKKILHKVEK